MYMIGNLQVTRVRVLEYYTLRGGGFPGGTSRVVSVWQRMNRVQKKNGTRSLVARACVCAYRFLVRLRLSLVMRLVEERVKRAHAK